MHNSKNRKKEMKFEEKISKLTYDVDYGELTGDFKKDLSKIKTFFKGDEQIKYREMLAGDDTSIEICFISCDGLVDTKTINDYMIRPIMEYKGLQEIKSAEMLLSKTFQIFGVKKSNDCREIIQGVASGDTLVLISGISEAMLLDTRGYDTRAISEPEGEKILSGPREGFNESMMKNLSMLRRKLCTEKLKIKYHSLGEKTNTKISVAYLEDVANPKIIKEVIRRLNTINIDGIIDSNYINELIRDNKWSPFRSTGYTERPDIVCAKLLEGRVAIFVDGSPVVLTAPYLFIENFQSNEDYYLSPYYTSFSRFLRILGFLLTTTLPAIYISIVGFHPELIPSSLLVSIVTNLKGVPLPAALEAFILIIVFEILRETALRVQTNVGQALSIVGALVIGQAAVEAQLVSSHMIIVVAMSGITSLLIPKMNAASLVIRFGNLILASCFGFFGLIIGFSLVLIHVLNLRSFCVLQLVSGEHFDFQNNKDLFFRAPWHKMFHRPSKLTKNISRQKPFSED